MSAGCAGYIKIIYGHMLGIRARSLRTPISSLLAPPPLGSSAAALEHFPISQLPAGEPRLSQPMHGEIQQETEPGCAGNLCVWGGKREGWGGGKWKGRGEWEWEGEEEKRGKLKVRRKGKRKGKGREEWNRRKGENRTSGERGKGKGKEKGEKRGVAKGEKGEMDWKGH